MNELSKVKGIGPIILKKLINAGIKSIKELIMIPPKELAELTGLSETVAYRISANARLLWDRSFITAKRIKEFEMKRNKITTGIRALDSILNGGFELGSIVELAGEYGSGKTQLCHQLSVTVQLPVDKGGLMGGALYIDTEGTFSAYRIENISERFRLNPDDVLERIIVARAFNTEHQIQIVRSSVNKIEEANIKLIIIDSIINHFRTEYPGRESLASRQQKLYRHISDLHRIAETYDILVVFTNHVISSPTVFQGPTLKPAGGNVIAHLSTYRIMLGRKSNMRYAKIIDSPKHPEQTCYFKITERGLEDV